MCGEPDHRQRRLEFRIPISPTPGFFAQVRLFDFALRRLGGAYTSARIRVIVGDRCDLDHVRQQNRWAESSNVVWERVPDALFDAAGMWGTANWRFNLPADDAEVIILSDADTLLLRDIDPILGEFDGEQPVVRGHMAHFPPPLGHESPRHAGGDFWPQTLRAYGVAQWPAFVRYSMDSAGTLPLSPPYFNLGFVAMNPAALAQFGHDIHWTEHWLREHGGGHMRCQIALTLIACRRGMDIGCLPAAYNAANDTDHLAANGLSVSDIRVLHYLREVEYSRQSFLLDGELEAFLSRTMENPCNMALQDMVRRYRDSL